MNTNRSSFRLLALVLVAAPIGCSPPEDLFPDEINVNCSQSIAPLAEGEGGVSIDCNANNVTNPPPDAGAATPDVCLESATSIGPWIKDGTGEAVLPPHAVVPADGLVWRAALDVPADRRLNRVEIVVKPIGTMPPDFAANLSIEAFDVLTGTSVLLDYAQDDVPTSLYFEQHSIVAAPLDRLPEGFAFELLRANVQAPKSNDPNARLAIVSGPKLGFDCP